MAKEDSNCYVGIGNPKEVRGDLLGSAKKLVVALKRFESFKDIRRERVEQTMNLAKVMKELAFLNNKLKAALPKTSLRALAPRKEVVAPPKKEKKKKQAPRPSGPPPNLELRKLEQELSKIEDKLGGL